MSESLKNSKNFCRILDPTTGIGVAQVIQVFLITTSFSVAPGWVI